MQVATSSRSNLSEGDVFEPGSGGTGGTASSASPVTPSCSTPPASLLSPPSAPKKQSPSKMAPRHTSAATSSLLGERCDPWRYH